MRVLTAHLSLRIQNSVLQYRADCRNAARRAKQKGYRWQTGTEANNAAAADRISTEYVALGYRFFRGSDLWAVIPRTNIKEGSVSSKFYKVLDGVAGQFTDKGILRVTYDDVELGRITLLVSHYLTLRQAEKFPWVNKQITEKLGELAREYGKGYGKVFYGGDQNENDRLLDTFKGAPLTSVGDALKKWPGTHGSRPIDVIASFDGDTAVEPIGWVVLGDKVFFLNSDHDLVEALFEIPTIEEQRKQLEPKPPVKGPPPAKPALDKSKLANPPLIGDGVPNKHSGKTGNKPPLRVVIHSAVMPCEPGRARQLGAMNQTSTTGSWHYAADPKEFVQCSFDSVICWHAPPNPRTIGIEMADWPKPWPTNRAASFLAAARRSWRWNSANHKAMLNNTARLTAELLIKHGLPIRFVSTAELKRNPNARGVTTHAITSAAFKQSTHWDPGFWPRRRFMDLVRKHAADIRAGR